MIANLEGIWRGTIYTDGLEHFQGLPGDDGWGGPPRTSRVGLWISHQGDYRSDDDGHRVSPFTGQVDGLEFYSIPVAGLVDDRGLVTLIFYWGRTDVTWAFNGHLRAGIHHGDISGEWTRMSWSNGLFLYQLGTMSVQRQGFILADLPHMAGLDFDLSSYF